MTTSQYCQNRLQYKTIVRKGKRAVFQHFLSCNDSKFVIKGFAQCTTSKKYFIKKKRERSDRNINTCE